MVLEDAEPKLPEVKWVTHSEAIEQYGVDPIGRAGVRNKLLRVGTGQLIRVWLADDVITVKGGGT